MSSTTIITRDATADDVPFLGWVMLEASRSHLPRGLWEHMNGHGERDVRRFLEAIATTDDVHLFHHSLFRIAEIDGERAAAACAFDGATQGFPVFLDVLPAILPSFGLAYDDATYHERAGDIEAGFPAWPLDRPWVIENVATVPWHRGRGAIQRVLDDLIERGRDRFEIAQIGCFLGNAPARAAYLRAGFEPIIEHRDARWEAAMGCPGTELLHRPYGDNAPTCRSQ
jgi:RimJ/RimL family protein N-acetyltransferase